MYRTHPQTGAPAGFLNSTFFIEKFLHYTHILFTHYGDRVKHWATFNEPSQRTTTIPSFPHPPHYLCSPDMFPPSIVPPQTVSWVVILAGPLPFTAQIARDARRVTTALSLT